MPDWDHVGWWRNAHHEREIRKVEGSILAKITARHRRRMMIDHAIVTTASILLAAAVVFTVAFLAYYASSPAARTSEPKSDAIYISRPVRVERIECR